MDTQEEKRQCLLFPREDMNITESSMAPLIPE